MLLQVGARRMAHLRSNTIWQRVDNGLDNHNSCLVLCRAQTSNSASDSRRAWPSCRPPTSTSPYCNSCSSSWKRMCLGLLRW